MTESIIKQIAQAVLVIMQPAPIGWSKCGQRSNPKER